MKTQKVAEFVLLASVGLFSLSLAAGVRADDTAEMVDMAEVNKLVDVCTQCHERDGDSNDPNMPIIGGYSEPYIISSMTAYKDKTRSCPEIEYISEDKKVEKTDMCRISRDLSDADIEKLALYYSKKKFRRANQDFNLTLARKGQLIHERDCEKCHSEGGSLASDDAGILAGQWTPYLKQQFFAFYAEKRQLDRKMKPKFNKLDKTEIEALLNFYASRGSL
jgi:sulfide dehydrogenase cytochrome subunit